MGFGIPQASTTIGSVSECVIPATQHADRVRCGRPCGPRRRGRHRCPATRIVSMDGEPITSWDQATAIIRESAGDPLAVVVERDGAVNSTLTATPLLSERYVVDANGQVVEVDGEKQTQNVGFLGIGTASEVVRQPITAVLPAVGSNIGGVVNIILHLPQRLVDTVEAAFGPEERDPNGPISVVGVGRLAGEITSLNSVPVADRAARSSGSSRPSNIALFVFNLIPLPPLDGGHIAGALIEAIRRGFAKLFQRPDPGPIDTAKIIPSRSPWS